MLGIHCICLSEPGTISLRLGFTFKNPPTSCSTDPVSLKTPSGWQFGSYGKQTRLSPFLPSTATDSSLSRSLRQRRLFIETTRHSRGASIPLLLSSASLQKLSNELFTRTHFGRPIKEGRKERGESPRRQTALTRKLSPTDRAFNHRPLPFPSYKCPAGTNNGARPQRWSTK